MYLPKPLLESQNGFTYAFTARSPLPTFQPNNFKFKQILKNRQTNRHQATMALKTGYNDYHHHDSNGGHQIHIHTEPYRIQWYTWYWRTASFQCVSYVNGICTRKINKSGKCLQPIQTTSRDRSPPLTNTQQSWACRTNRPRELCMYNMGEIKLNLILFDRPIESMANNMAKSKCHPHHFHHAASNLI